MDLLPEARAYAFDCVLTSACPALAARLHGAGLHATALLPGLVGLEARENEESTGARSGARATPDPGHDHVDALAHTHAHTHTRTLLRYLHALHDAEPQLLAANTYADMLRVLLSAGDARRQVDAIGPEHGAPGARDGTDTHAHTHVGESITSIGVSMPPRTSDAAPVPATANAADAAAAHAAQHAIERVVENTVMQLMRQYVLLRLCMSGLMSAQLRTLHKGIRHALNIRHGGPPLRSAMSRSTRGASSTQHASRHETTDGGVAPDPDRDQLPIAREERGRTPSTAASAATSASRPVSHSPVGTTDAAAAAIGIDSPSPTDATAVPTAASSTVDGAAASRTVSTVSMHSLHVGPALGQPALSRFNITDYDWIGFDLDHTLVTYRQREFNKHMFYASARYILETAARTCASLQPTGTDGVSDAATFSDRLTSLADASLWTLFCAAVLSNVASSPSRDATEPTVTPHPSSLDLATRALRAGDVHALAELHGSEAAVAGAASSVHYPEQHARSHVVVDARLGNVLVLDTAAVVVHASHGGLPLSAFRIQSVYGSGPLDGYALGEPSGHMPRSTRGPALTRPESASVRPVSSRGGEETLRQPAPTAESTRPGEESTVPGAARHVRRYATVHTGFDECLPALVTAVVASCDARLGLSIGASMPFDYSGMVDVCTEALRACFSSYCSYGFSAITDDLPRFVDVQPNVKGLLQALRKLPLPLRQSSSSPDPRMVRMHTARTVTGGSTSSMRAGGAPDAMNSHQAPSFTRRLRLFVLTNSAWDHTNKLMTHAYGRDWQDLFDMVVTSASKKGFYVDTPLTSRLASARPSLTPEERRSGSMSPSAHVSRTHLRPVDVRTGKIAGAASGVATPSAVTRTMTSSQTGAGAAVTPKVTEAVWGVGAARTPVSSVVGFTAAPDLRAHKVYAGGNFDALMTVLTAQKYACAGAVREARKSEPGADSLGPSGAGEVSDDDTVDDEDAAVCYFGDHIVHDVVAPTARGWHSIAILPNLRALAQRHAEGRNDAEVASATESASSVSVRTSARAPPGRTTEAVLHMQTAAPTDIDLLCTGVWRTRPTLVAGQVMRSAALAVPSLALLATVFTPSLQAAIHLVGDSNVGRLPLAPVAGDARVARPGAAALPSGRSGGFLQWISSSLKSGAAVDPASYHAAMGRCVRAGRITSCHVTRMWSLPAPGGVLRESFHLNGVTLLTQQQNAGGPAGRHASSVVPIPLAAEREIWDRVWQYRHAHVPSEPGLPVAYDGLSSTLAGGPAAAVGDTLVQQSSVSASAISVAASSAPPPHARARSPSAGSRASDEGPRSSRGSVRSSSPASLPGSGDERSAGCLPWLFLHRPGSSARFGGPNTSTRSVLSTAVAAGTPRHGDRALVQSGALTSCQRTLQELSRSRSWFLPVTPSSAPPRVSVDALIIECGVMCAGPRDTPAWAPHATDNSSRRRGGALERDAQAAGIEMWRLLAAGTIVEESDAPRSNML